MLIQVISRQEIFYHLFQKVPLKKRKKYADLLKKRNFACPQKPTIFKEILEYLNWVIFNHACKYHFKLTIFSKISIQEHHIKENFNYFFEANSFDTLPASTGFF